MYCPNQACPTLGNSGIPVDRPLPGQTVCAACGAQLELVLPEWAEEEEEERVAPEPATKLVPCLTVTDTALLPIIENELDEAGIPFTVRHEGVQNLLGAGAVGVGFNLATGAPVVLVEESRLDEAKALLDEFAQDMEDRLRATSGEPPSVDGEPASCPACGRALERQPGDAPLDNCYHCGAELGTGR